jgi:hypothetical protein
LNRRAALALGVTTLVLAPVGFCSMFSVFQLYDDEGYFLWTVRDYLGGHLTYQLYGPFYYELMGGVFRVLGLAVTTDNGRIITLALWLLGSLIGGLAVLRLTRNLWLGVAGQFLTFHAFSTFTSEPMHPQALIGVLLVTFAALAAYRARFPRASVTLIGAVVAAIVLVKINVGVFGGLAVTFALVACASGRWRRWLLPAMAVVIVAAPLVLMTRLLQMPWVWQLALVMSLSTAGVAIAGFVAGAPHISRGDAFRLISGGTALAVVCLGIAAAAGLRPADLVGSVVSALGLPELFVVPARVNLAHVGWAVLSLASAVAILLARLGARMPPAVPAFSRIGIGAFAWFSVLLLPSWYWLLALPLAWVAMLPPRGDADNPTDPWTRVLLPVLAVLEALQVYPVAGSQEWLAAFMLVPVGAVIFNDGLRQLRALALATGSESWLTVSKSLPRGAVVVNVAVWGLFVYLSGMTYASGRPLGLPGTDLMRLPPVQVSGLQSLASVTDRDCMTLITLPRMESLNLWTEKAGLASLYSDVGIWIFSLDAAKQQSIVTELRGRQGVCVVRSQAVLDFEAQGRPVPRRPLVEYIDTDLQSAGTFWVYELLISKPATQP